MRGLEAGAGLAVIAVIVVFFGGGELLGDILRDAVQESKFVWLPSAADACRGIAMPTNSVASAIISAATSVMRRPEAETRESHES